MKITSYSVKNYQFTLILFLMVAVVGAVTLFTMPRAEDPQIYPPTFPIIAIYPGTSPQDMEELVVKPIENRLYELENVDKIVTSIEDGLAVLQVEFNYGENVDDKYQEVVREINSLRPELPKDLYSLEVKRVDPSDVNILQVALVSENAGVKSLKTTADALKDQLETVPNLKNVEFSGLPEEVVQVDLDLEKIARLHIPLNLIIGSIKSEDANIPGGNIHLGDKTYNVKTSGNYQSVEEIKQTVVYNQNGSLLALGDVAEVEQKFREPKHLTRINGYRCVLVTAAQKDGANISQVQSDILPVLDNFEQTLPENIVLVRNFDQAENVSHRLGGLGIDFMIAIGLVLITLLPLGTRASLIVMISIPLSLALGLVGLNAFGFSLNQLTIVGLVLALGLLVDDSIVVVENIERWLREGHSRKEAAIKATQQIGKAVLGCTATLIIAFMPLLFLPGAPGEFIRGLPMAVITSVLASMIVSLTVVPFLASAILKKDTHPEGNVFLRSLQKLIHATYSRIMGLALKKPVITLFIALALFGGSMVIFPLAGFKLFPTSEKPIFLVNVRMPMQTNMEESNRITHMVEDSLRQHDEIAFFTANVGRGNPRIYYNVPVQQEKSDFSQIFIQLQEDTPPTEKVQLIETLRHQFRTFPYAQVEVKDFEQGPPIEAPIAIRIFGDDLDTLRSLSRKVETILRDHSGTIYVNNELNSLKTDLKTEINTEKARTLGILTADIDQTVRMAVAGLEVGSYSDEKGDGYSILVNAPRETYPSLEVLKHLFVYNALGTPIPLQQVAELTFESSPVKINHFNKKRYATVTSYTQKDVLANDVLPEVVPLIEQIDFPAGYSFALAGEAESEQDAFGGGFFTVILVTIFLFIAVLILQFKTFKGMLIVLSVIPLGIVGGITLLFLNGEPMSFIAIIGFIGLAGIEVKNSILLVDFTNQLRSEGMELNQAIEKAGELRFLPVVLTSLTAIGGMIPLALNPNPQISPLAIVLIGGLISSTLLSRIVTPVVYKLLPPAITSAPAANA